MEEQNNNGQEKVIIKKEIGLIKIIISFVVGLLIGALVLFLIVRPNLYNFHRPAEIKTDIDEADLVIDTGALGIHTTADFLETILGEAKEKKDLIVMERPIYLITQVTNTGLFSWEIFSKAKNIKYYGTGVYTVDLSKITENSISVDNDNKTVTLTIPRSCLQYINPEIEKTEFEDVERGSFLAMGDITLTPEENNLLESEIIEQMRVEFTNPTVFKIADKYAEKLVWELFQPKILQIAPDFEFIVQFDESTENLDLTKEK